MKREVPLPCANTQTSLLRFDWMRTEGTGWDISRTQSAVYTLPELDFTFRAVHKRHPKELFTSSRSLTAGLKLASRPPLIFPVCLTSISCLCSLFLLLSVCNNRSLKIMMPGKKKKKNKMIQSVRRLFSSLLLCPVASAQRWCITPWAPCRRCLWRPGWSRRACPG